MPVVASFKAALRPLDDGAREEKSLYLRTAEALAGALEKQPGAVADRDVKMMLARVSVYDEEPESQAKVIAEFIGELKKSMHWREIKEVIEHVQI